MSIPMSLEIWLFLPETNMFPQSRINDLQSFNKMDNLNTELHDFIWTQDWEFPKHWKNKLIVNFFFADFRTSFSYLNKIFWLKNTKIFTWPQSLDHLSITKFLKAETLYMVQITKYILDMIYAVFRTFIWQIWQVLLLCFVSFHSWAAPLF